jgi:shikimate dehydrogenase
VVNATSLGMGLAPDEPLPCDPAALHAGQVVADLVYHPLVTPLLAAAEAQGARAVGGLGMLVHQAAHAFVRWTGVEAPIEAMAAAARAGLAPREGGPQG